MKKIVYTLLFIVASLTAINTTAQMRTSYFMEGSYFRTELNPALAPTRGYIALPAMSGVGVSLSNNFLLPLLTLYILMRPRSLIKRSKSFSKRAERMLFADG